MKIARSYLASVLARRLEKNADPKRLALDTAAYLITEKRVGELSSLLRDIEQYRADNEHIIEVSAVSAFPLTDSLRADIRRKIRAAYPAAKQIIIDERIDHSVVGGVRLELANQQLDLTVRSKLSQFKQLTVAKN